MIGTTGLKGLQIDCIIGIYEHERTKAQPLVVDVELDYDFAAAARSDAIRDAVDYDLVAVGISELARQKRFHLIETMAEEAAAMLLSSLVQVQTVRLEIRKPDAVPAAACSFVRVERTRT
jgi:7,8-dihydroneopterin aldolase/epimerase/oxygenase